SFEEVRARAIAIDERDTVAARDRVPNMFGLGDRRAAEDENAQRLIGSFGWLRLPSRGCLRAERRRRNGVEPDGSGGEPGCFQKISTIRFHGWLLVVPVVQNLDPASNFASGPAIRQTAPFRSMYGICGMTRLAV